MRLVNANAPQMVIDVHDQDVMNELLMFELNKL